MTDDAIYARILDAYRPLSLEPVEGPGKTSQPVDLPCAECAERGGVIYIGSTVLDGALEWRHLVHTEVDHHFHCGACRASWTVFKML